METIRIVLALFAQFQLQVFQLDVKPPGYELKRKEKIIIDFIKLFMD
jgi:hypothetical protein